MYRSMFGSVIVGLVLAFTAGAEDKPAKDAKTTPPPAESKSIYDEEPTVGPVPGNRKKSAAGVLDFETEVIEGERKAPDLFVHMQSGTPNLDAILFQRTNFNDFFEIEKGLRTQYRKYTK